ncbi:spore gernimation protein [Paenibacillus sp. 79R4]|uniref:GerAB/ArcD/ProY family transporter n=1 Tax=Paenibacillus sp. 79R4 TaxID=2212847 RepID=UPI0015B94976|nr:GerAB/ArcD/ProY family transporter [Paenibacillus sp. 79R4]NWL90125.1 spore gernimation protein [Paenibacillus sp. 79R4]
MLTEDKKITTSQTAVIISNCMLGSGILTLPRVLADKMNNSDGWISIILGGILVVLTGTCIVKLCQRFPGKTLFQFSRDLMGKWLGSFFNVGIAAFYIFIAAFELRVMFEVTTLYLLEDVPRWGIMMSFIWVGLYLILGGLGAIARLYEIILPITIVVFVFSMILSSKVFEIDNLLPVLGDGVLPALQGVGSTVLVFLGHEIMFILTASMKHPGKAGTALVMGITVPLFLNLIAFIMVIGGISVHGAVSSTWPIVDLLRSFEIKGLFFERFDFFLLVVWIMQILTTFSILQYISTTGIAQTFRTSKKPILYLSMPVIFIIASFPRDVNELFQFGGFFANVGVAIFIILPPLMLLYAIIFKKGDAR